jgi:hypothetical protein
VLGADPHPDEPSRDALEDWKAGKQADAERRAEWPPPAQHPGDHAVLDEDLDALCEARGELPAPLNRPELLDPTGA